VVTTVAHAAEILGISQGAVRKRIERGQLNGRKVDGQWRIFLDASDTTDATRQEASHATEPETTTTTPDSSRDQAQTGHDTARTSVVSATAQAQLDAFRDAILRPHLERIEELAKDVGRLTAERDAIGRERDRLDSHLRTDRVLTDYVVTALEAERDAALKSADRLRDENAFLHAIHDRARPDNKPQPPQSADQPQPRTDRPTASPTGQGEEKPSNPAPDTLQSETSNQPQPSWWRRLFGGGG